MKLLVKFFQILTIALTAKNIYALECSNNKIPVELAKSYNKNFTGEINGQKICFYSSSSFKDINSFEQNLLNLKPKFAVLKMPFPGITQYAVFPMDKVSSDQKNQEEIPLHTFSVSFIAIDPQTSLSFVTSFQDILAISQSQSKKKSPHLRGIDNIENAGSMHFEIESIKLASDHVLIKDSVKNISKKIQKNLDMVHYACSQEQTGENTAIKCLKPSSSIVVNIIPVKSDKNLVQSEVTLYETRSTK